ncbi:hypothetical protein RF11_09512 [Thelohanellus kitauei]|uniref:Uncharacterized protein n=1 Tax=Thelohanellus kitauei TaxID=669202 RepID=A0A0C2N3U3_THEKT|nr:hypothetical protein RF11_09512 [Thelohanellus kitauei]
MDSLDIFTKAQMVSREKPAEFFRPLQKSINSLEYDFSSTYQHTSKNELVAADDIPLSELIKCLSDIKFVPHEQILSSKTPIELQVEELRKTVDELINKPKFKECLETTTCRICHTSRVCRNSQRWTQPRINSRNGYTSQLNDTKYISNNNSHFENYIVSSFSNYSPPVGEINLTFSNGDSQLEGPVDSGSHIYEISFRSMALFDKGNVSDECRLPYRQRRAVLADSV